MNCKSRSVSVTILFSVFALSLAACGPADENKSESTSNVVRPAKTIVVKAENVALQRIYSASVLASSEVELSFRVTGRIVELPIRAAQNVKKDDVIAQLDKRDFEAEVSRLSSQIDQAKAQLSAMVAGARTEDIASLRASVTAAEVQLDAAEKQIARTRTLFEKGIVAKARMDQDQATLDVAKAQLDAAKQELTKGQAGSRQEEVAAQEAVIKGMESQLKSAQDALSDTTLRAPFDGVIAKRHVENFTNIQAKEPIAVLQILKTLDVSFDVPAPDVPSLAARRGSIKSVVQLDSLPGESFEAKVVEFSTQPDPVTQTYRGRAAIKPPNGITILPGMAGKITLTDTSNDRSANTISIPATAITSEPDGSPFVWIVSKPDNKVAKRPVETGEAAGANIFIKKGLSEGDVIVTAGVTALLPDMIVRPISKIGD